MDSTAESGQETTDGYVNTVWYRIEPLGNAEATFAIKNASYNYYAELYEYPGGGTPTDFADLVNGYSNFVTWLGNGDSSDDEKLVLLDSTSAYYLVVTNNDFTEGIWGTFTLSVFLPAVIECAAADGANLSSSTVSVSSGWVRDDQYRIVDSDTYTGDLDYTKSFDLTCPIPAGDYKVELYARLGGTSGSILIQMRKNGKPIGHNVGGWNISNNDPKWIELTHMNFDGTGQSDFGGPRYVTLSETDTLSFAMGAWDDAPNRYMEVLTIRLTLVLPIAPLPSWRQAINQIDTWPANSHVSIDNFRYRDGVLYGFLDAYANDVPVLGIWTWEVNGPDITSISGDAPIGFGGSVVDLHTEAPRGSSSLDWQVHGHDFDVLPNGDIIAAWVETISPSDFSLTTVRPVVGKYDATNDSWSIITTDLWGFGLANRILPYISVEADPSGEYVYIVWSEGRQTGFLATVGTWWRCKRYNVAANTFTELGSGITAFPNAPATDTVDGHFNYHLRVRVSPAGVPWVIWPSYDPQLPTNAWYERCFAYYWNGSTWVDSEVPNPSLVPADVDSGFLYASYAAGEGSGNYISYAVYGFWYADLTFCTLNEGVGENPAIAFQYVYNDQTGSPFWDTSGFAYFEYNGSPGEWVNEAYFVEGNAPAPATGFGYTEPQKFAQNYLSYPWPVVGAWTQGFHLDNDGRSPWIFSQKGYRSSSADHVYAAKIGAGPSIKLYCNGFPDEETYPWGPPPQMGGWTDVTTNAGLIADGRPIVFYRDRDSWGPGIKILAGLGCGNFIPLNWRFGSKRPSKTKLRR